MHSCLHVNVLMFFFISFQDVCFGLGESMTEDLKCAMLIQQSHESLDSLQGQIEGSSNDSNALKVKDADKNHSPHPQSYTPNVKYCTTKLFSFFSSLQIS